MATPFPPMTVTFDDGTEVIVQPKQRDMVRAEAAGCDFTAEGQVFGKQCTVAFVALQRMERAGRLPEGLMLPASLDEFTDLADVDTAVAAGEDPEGKG